MPKAKAPKKLGRGGLAATKPILEGGRPPADASNILVSVVSPLWCDRALVRLDFMASPYLGKEPSHSFGVY